MDKIVPDNTNKGGTFPERKRQREERDFLDETDTGNLLLTVDTGRAITLSVALRQWCKHPGECDDKEERDHVIPIRDRKRKAISKWLPRLQERGLITKTTVGESAVEDIKTPELKGKDGKMHRVTPKAHEVVLKSTPELDELFRALRPHVARHAEDLVVELLQDSAHPEASKAAELLRRVLEEDRDESVDDTSDRNDVGPTPGDRR